MEEIYVEETWYIFSDLKELCKEKNNSIINVFN